MIIVNNNNKRSPVEDETAANHHHIKHFWRTKTFLLNTGCLLNASYQINDGVF